MGLYQESRFVVLNEDGLPMKNSGYFGGTSRVKIFSNEFKAKRACSYVNEGGYYSLKKATIIIDIKD